MVKLRAKSRAVYNDRPQAFNWIHTAYRKVTDYDEAEQTSCFNEPHFTSPLET